MTGFRASQLICFAFFFTKISDKTKSCGVLNGGCEGNCTFYTKMQKTICSCQHGYRLKADGRTCEGQSVNYDYYNNHKIKIYLC